MLQDDIFTKFDSLTGVLKKENIDSDIADIDIILWLCLLDDQNSSFFDADTFKDCHIQNQPINELVTRLSSGVMLSFAPSASAQEHLQRILSGHTNNTYCAKDVERFNFAYLSTIKLLLVKRDLQYCRIAFGLEDEIMILTKDSSISKIMIASRYFHPDFKLRFSCEIIKGLCKKNSIELMSAMHRKYQQIVSQKPTTPPV